MGEFNILFNTNNKSLVIRNKIKLHQYESMADKITFTIPKMYNTDLSLQDMNCVMIWTDPSSIVHTDILEVQEETFKDEYFKVVLPITSELNRFAGDIEAKLEFTLVNYEEEKIYKIITEPVIIPIFTTKDYFRVIPDESFNALDERINELRALTDELNANAELYDKQKADGLILDRDENTLQLSSHDEPIGNKVEIDLVDEEDRELDKEDGHQDGLIDLDELSFEQVLL